METIIITVAQGERADIPIDAEADWITRPVVAINGQSALLIALRKAPINYGLTKMKGTGRNWKFHFEKVR